MSIINKTKYVTVSKALDSYSGDDLIGFYFDNHIGNFIQKNIESINIIDLDICEQLFQAICRNMNLYSKKSKEYNEIKEKESEKQTALNEKKKELSNVSVKDTANYDKLLNAGVLTEESVEKIKETTNNKITVRDEYLKLSNEYMHFYNRGKECSSIIEECKKELFNSYSLLLSLYGNINVDNLHDFSKESIDELATNLEKSIGKNAQVIVNELYNLILSELLFYTDVYNDLIVFSFDELTDEKLEQLDSLSKKYKHIRDIIDLKYEILRSFFIDSYKEKLNPKKDCLIAYKTILYYANYYLEEAYSNGIEEFKENDVDYIMDRIDNTSPQGYAKNVAFDLGRMYSRHIKIK